MEPAKNAYHVAMETAIECLLVDPKPTDTQRALLERMRDALLERPGGVVKLEAHRADGLTLLAAASVAAYMHVGASSSPEIYVNLGLTPMNRLFVNYAQQFLVVLGRARKALVVYDDESRLVYGDGSDAGRSVLTARSAGKFRPPGATIIIASGQDVRESPGCTTLWLCTGTDP
jgi:hypothetical protein